MAEKYRHILFDLDHTLWDFDKNSEEVLQGLYHRYELHALQLFTVGQFVLKFRDVNRRLWNQYNVGKIGRDHIRAQRFPAIFSELSCPEEHIPRDIGLEYLKQCPLRSNVMPYAHDTLAYLQKKYTLQIVTNGFEDVQHIKLKSAGLTDYFQEIITSEICGYKKPDKRMFEYILEKTGAEANECVMVGDTPETDILGAQAALIDTIFYNPSGASCHAKPTYEIHCLSELQKIL